MLEKLRRNQSTGQLDAMRAPRKLLWRYKYADEQAARPRLEVPEDPRKHLPLRRGAGSDARANLKDRRRSVYDRLVGQWNEWNATTLPLDPQSVTLGFTGAELADHYGVKAGS